MSRDQDRGPVIVIDPSVVFAHCGRVTRPCCEHHRLRGRRRGQMFVMYIDFGEHVPCVWGLDHARIACFVLGEHGWCSNSMIVFLKCV